MQQFREAVEADDQYAIDGLTVHGCDILHVDDAGLIDDFTVMVRPLRAAQALSARMATEFAAEMGTSAPDV